MFGAFLSAKSFSRKIKTDIFTPDRRQSRTLLTIDERGSKISRNSIFQSMLVDTINVFNCRLSSVILKATNRLVQIRIKLTTID